jgi:hypothetical protein
MPGSGLSPPPRRNNDSGKSAGGKSIPTDWGNENNYIIRPGILLYLCNKPTKMTTVKICLSI